ncbi:MAG: PAS domain S-box protein, partial [Deltaproteobacteria bacterium]|nr:PAS domain S-box protein [Deltaproteobacteria bacterium]
CHPDDLKKSDERLKKHFAGQADYYDCETRLKHKDGTWIWVQNRGQVMERDGEGKPVRLTGTLIDITDRKHFEELDQAERDLGMALSRSRSLAETLAGSLEAAIRVSGMDCGGLYLINEQDESLNLAAHQGLSETFVRQVERYAVDTAATRLVLKGEPIYISSPEISIQEDFLRGVEGLSALGVIPIHYQDRVVGCLNVGSHGADQIDRFSRQALERIALFSGSFIVQAQQEEKLRQSRQDLKTLLNTIQDLLFILDLGGNIIHCNNAVVDLLGYSYEELHGKTVLMVHPEERHEEAKGVIQAMLAGDTESCHIPVQTKEGRLIPVETKVKKGRWGGQEVLIGITRDITERTRAEEERLEWERHLLAAQKRESLGTLAGAVAHRFNNLLGALMGNLELSLDDLSREGEIRENLTAALEATHQAADLSRLMLTYVGQSVPGKSRVDLSREVERIMPLIKASQPGKIRLTQAIAAGLPTVEVGADGIRQITINLAANAWESLGGEGGEVSLTTGAAFFDEFYLRAAVSEEPLPSGTYVYLEISDTGSGITDEVRSRMFDPFFSTKFLGRGLGLATVWGLVRASRGGIVVDSEPGKGTTVRVLLPSAGTVERPKPRPSKTAALAEPQGSGTILLVEDEETVRRMSRTMLNRLGFRVLAAKDGEEAVALFQTLSGEIDGVLTDLTMPGMSGWEVLEAVRVLKPGVPVILASGYEEAQVRDQNRKEQPQFFLHKPYRLDDLKEALGKIMA